MYSNMNLIALFSAQRVLTKKFAKITLKSFNFEPILKILMITESYVRESHALDRF